MDARYWDPFRKEYRTLPDKPVGFYYDEQEKKSIPFYEKNPPSHVMEDGTRFAIKYTAMSPDQPPPHSSQSSPHFNIDIRNDPHFSTHQEQQVKPSSSEKPSHKGLILTLIVCPVLVGLILAVVRPDFEPGGKYYSWFHPDSTTQPSIGGQPYSFPMADFETDSPTTTEEDTTTTESETTTSPEMQADDLKITVIRKIRGKQYNEVVEIYKWYDKPHEEYAKKLQYPKAADGYFYFYFKDINGKTIDINLYRLKDKGNWETEQDWIFLTARDFMIASNATDWIATYKVVMEDGKICYFSVKRVNI